MVRASPTVSLPAPCSLFPQSLRHTAPLSPQFNPSLSLRRFLAREPIHCHFHAPHTPLSSASPNLSQPLPSNSAPISQNLTLDSTLAFFILDSDGKRLLAKYYPS